MTDPMTDSFVLDSLGKLQVKIWEIPNISIFMAL